VKEVPKKKRVEVGPESLKLTKLTKSDDIEAFLIASERELAAHNGRAERMGYSTSTPH
jgi:hypothetical protein